MNENKKKVLVFGYGLGFIAAFFALRLWVKHGWLVFPGGLLLAGLVLVVMSARDWQSVVPFYRRWMAVARVIGGIVSALVLTLLFYFVFAPAGIILRLLRKDILRKDIRPVNDSYWQKRPRAEFSREDYLRQF